MKKIGTLPNHEGDGNEDVKNKRLISSTTSLEVYDAFLSISVPTLHNYDVK